MFPSRISPQMKPSSVRFTLIYQVANTTLKLHDHIEQIKIFNRCFRSVFPFEQPFSSLVYMQIRQPATF